MSVPFATSQGPDLAIEGGSSHRRHRGGKMLEPYLLLLKVQCIVLVLLGGCCQAHGGVGINSTSSIQQQQRSRQDEVLAGLDQAVAATFANRLALHGSSSSSVGGGGAYANNIFNLLVDTWRVKERRGTKPPPTPLPV